MNKLLKISALSTLVLLILILILIILGSFYFFNLSVARGEKEFLSKSDDLQEFYRSDQDEPIFEFAVIDTENKTLNQMAYEDYYQYTSDGLRLHAYYIPAENPTNQTIIVAHGYSSEGKNMVDFALFLHHRYSYNVLLPDARGHGRSEGDYVGFGWHDRLDYLGWINDLIEKHGEELQIGLIGVSMGGATVAMTSGESLPPQVKAIIEDCGYTGVAEELSYQLSRMYHLPSFPLIQTTSLLTKLKCGFDFYEASALDQVKKASLPMLFIHGDADTFVPVSMGHELYDACASTTKEVWIVEGAGHALSHATAPDEYEERIHEFFARFMQ